MIYIVFVFLLVIKYNYNSDFANLFIGVILLLFVISIIVTIYESKKCTINFADNYINNVENDYLKIKFSSNIKIFNPRINLKIYIRKKQYPGDNVFNLTDLSADSLDDSNIYKLYPGTYEAKFIHAKFLGLFGLFKIKRKLNETIIFTVYPNSQKFDYKKLKSIKQKGEGLSSMFKGDDYTEIYEVREFVEGDDLKHLHHALTAKFDTNMIKVGSKSERIIYLYEIDDNLPFKEILDDLRKIRYLCENKELTMNNSFCYVKYKKKWKIIMSIGQYYKFVDEVYKDYEK